MTEWRRPSGGRGECLGVRVSGTGLVQLALAGDEDPPLSSYPPLGVTRVEFAAFIAAAKAGEYDDLAGDQDG